MPRKSPYIIELSEGEREKLEGIVTQYTLPYYIVTRAKIILYAAEGFSNKRIGEKLDVSRPLVSKWRKRFFSKRLQGLKDKPRPGRPAVFSP